MAPESIVVNELLDTLEEQDYDTVLDFIQFLSNFRKGKAPKNNRGAEVPPFPKPSCKIRSVGLQSF